MCILTLTAIFGGGLGAIGGAIGLTGGAATLAGAGLVGAEIVGLGATIAGGVASTVAGVQQAEQNAAIAEYQAKVADDNAKIASQSAEANQLQGNQKRLALMQQMQQMQGHVRTDFAARGVVLGSGTPNDYEADLADSYDMDRRNLEYDIATRSWQYKVQASEQTQQANMYRAQADAYRSNIPGIWAGGLLSTAGNAASSMLGSISLGGSLGLFGGGAEKAASDASGGLFEAGVTSIPKLGKNTSLVSNSGPLGAGVTMNEWWLDPRIAKMTGGK